MAREFWLRYLQRFAWVGSFGLIWFLAPVDLGARIAAYLSIPFLLLIASLLEFLMVLHYQRLKDLEPPAENPEPWDPEHPTRRGYRARYAAKEDDVG